MKKLRTLTFLTVITVLLEGCITLPFMEQPVETKQTVQELILAGQVEEAKKIFLSMPDQNESDEKGNTVLHAAAAAGNSDLIIYFLTKEVDYTLMNKDGDMAIHVAIAKGNYGAAKTLAEIDNMIFLRNRKNKNAIDMMIDYNSKDWYDTLITEKTSSKKDENGRTMVHYFVTRKNENAINKCIEKGIPLSEEDIEGKTPLMLAYEDAVNEKSINIAAALIMARCEPVRGIYSYFEDAVRTRNVSLRFDDNQTPLHIAAVQGQTGIIKYLLANGASTKVQDNTGTTPLHEAVRYGHLDVVKLLIEHGANVNATDSLGKTPLLLIIPKENQNEIYNELLNKRADATAKDLYGDTALHIATMCNADISVLQKLYDSGADVNERNKSGVTPLSLAIEYGLVDHMQFYSSKGADINAEDNTNSTPLTKAFAQDISVLKTLVNSSNISSRDSKGNTALHLAIKYNVSLDYLRYLIECGADIDARNSDGESVLYLAVQNNNKAVGEILIGRGANVYATNNASFSPLRLALTNGGETQDWVLCSTVIEGDDGNGNTPLHFAAEWKLDDSISYIIMKGGQLNKKNANGETPLYNAVKADSPSTIRLLISKGADPDSHDLLGNTPLHFAVRWKAIKAATELLANGASVNAKNTSGKTPLSDAARSGDLSMVALLVNKGADINTSDSTGKTILTDAIQSEYADMVKLILSYGASINIQDMYGRNSYHEAVEIGDLKIIELLRDKGGNPLSRDSFGKTPFSLSMSKGIQVIDALLANDKYLTDSDGNNPLHAAVSAHASVDVFKMILAKGYPLDQRNGQSLTPLELAIQMQQTGLAVALIEKGADPFVTDNNGECSLTLAFNSANEELLNAIVNNSANAADLQGDSILHYAARNADAKTVQFLLEKGLDRSRRNNAGETPYDVAKRWKRNDIANLLL